MQDMHYADFAEDDVGPMIQLESVLSLTGGEQSAALLQAIKEYEASKWKVIGQKVGKPAKVGDHYDPSETDYLPWLTSSGLRAVCERAFRREDLTN